MPPPPTLARVSRFLEDFARRKSRGFTLAEVLITLSIIGIIAAMTVPNLMAKHQKHIWAVKAQKAYSLLNNRTKIMLAEKGCFELSCVYSNPTTITYDKDGNRNWHMNGTTDNANTFIHDLFPDAEEVPANVYNTVVYPVNYVTTEALKTLSTLRTVPGGNTFDKYFRIPKANMLIRCEHKSLTNYYDVHPDNFVNPDLKKLHQRGQCNIVTEYPAKKYIDGRNNFTIAFLEDGRWVPWVNREPVNTHCGTKTSTYLSSCLYRMQKNGWVMDY